MSTETLNPPVDMDAAFDQAIAEHNSNAQGTPTNPSQPPKAEKPVQKAQTQQKPQEQPKKGTQKDAPKGEAKTDKPKSPWEKLEQVKPVEEGQTQEETETTTEIPDTAPKDQQSWTRMKKDIKTANEELKQLRPLKEQFEKLQKDHEGLKNKPFVLPEEVKTELEELRTLRAAYDVEDTPEWGQRIKAPFQQREAYLKKVAAHYKINEEQLLAASDEPDPIVRAEKMEEVLRTGEKETAHGAGFDGQLLKPSTNST